MPKEIILQPSPMPIDIATVMTDVAGQLAPSSRRIYLSDAKHFATWLSAHGLNLLTVDRTSMIIYRQYLADKYAKRTASRMFITARRLLDEAVKSGVLGANVASSIKGFKGTDDDETPHVALSKEEGKALLGVVDRTTNAGRRDYAIIMLLIRTGIRRAEAAGLTLGDFSSQQGHHICTIRHGKGNKRRIVKLPVDVMRAITDYLAHTGRSDQGPDAPLFVRVRREDKVTEDGLRPEGIEIVVTRYAKKAGIEKLTPHGLRATFVTIALESGAKLQQVQYAVGHKDPRTTERYQKRKLNLDDNATDYVRF